MKVVSLCKNRGMKALIFGTLFLLAEFSSAQMIRCRGDIAFWVESKPGNWKKIELKSGSFYEEIASRASVLKIGKDKRFPAAEISPFYGITWKIRNPDLKIQSDNENWFTLEYQKKKMSCDVHFGMGDL